MNTINRLKVFGILCLIAPVCIIIQLINLQTIRHEEFTTRTQQRVYTKTRTNVFRGRILDRNGKILAESLRSYAIALTKNNVKDKDLTLNILAEILHLDLNALKKQWHSKRN